MSVTFHQIYHTSLLFSALYGRCYDSKHGKQKTHGPSFVCCGWQRGTPVAIPSHQCHPSRSKKKRGAGKAFKNHYCLESL